MNTIGDVRLARERRKTLEQPGYKGKNHYSVTYAGQTVKVHAADETAAMFVAAKYWGYSFRRPEYHQNAVAVKLGYTPDAIFG